MPGTRYIPLYRRWLAGVLAALLGLGPLATPAYAAVTLLGDQPLKAQNAAKPNIMLTVDDSTSMLYDFLPDSVIGQYCRDITGKMSAACGILDQNNDLSGVSRGKYQSGGYIFEQYGLPFGAYNPTFDTSGPGAGCDLTTFASSTCSGGISPDASPVTLAPWTLYSGIERYPNPSGPPPGKSPKAGQVYEYWTLWPAPVHNSELNHAYYNPRLNYEPPVDSTGAQYPQMNAANTSNWTRVPADPWATTVQYIDLTAPVTVGLWCNSDWSVGHESDPAYCRTNGTGPSATTSSASTIDGDYTYPWAPPGIDPSLGSTTAQAIASTKIDTTNSNALTATWTTAQNAQYYFQNDNVLWCDATSAKWPHQGSPQSQTCIGGSSTPQVCLRHDQTCGTGTAQTCVGAVPQTCGGQQPQTCNNLTAQVCNNAVTQTCAGVTPQTCAGVGNQTCAGIAPQSCSGVTPQTCANITAQTCNGVNTQSCNLVDAVCNPPNPASCTTDWSPPGCNLCSGECGTCTLATTCPNGTCSNSGASCTNAHTDCPQIGTCSASGASCANSSQCPQIAGNCSADGASCTADAQCSNSGKCSVNAFLTCHADGDCATIPGTCTTSGIACVDNSVCTSAGHCTITNAVCADDSTCTAQPGQCTVSHAGCFDNTQCPDTGGACTITSATCSNDGQCPIVPGACNLNNQACNTTADCAPSGQCSLVPTICNGDAQCPQLPGQCSTTHSSCQVDNDCGTVAGQCSISATACTDNSGCPPAGQTCSETGQACTAGTYSPICSLTPFASCSEPTYCPIVNDRCSIDSSACSPFYFNFWPFFAYDFATCNPINVAGHCSVDSAFCLDDTYCSSTPGPSGSAVCSDLKNDATNQSLLHDANNAGEVCRHNNQAYGATAAAPFNYPNAQFNTPVMGGTGTDACVASPRYATIPRHYYKTSIEWCDTPMLTAGDKWIGYGTRANGGMCQDSPDTSHTYPRFYQFGQPAGTDNYGTAAFQRIDFDIAKRATATYTHTWTDDNGPESVTRSFDGSTPDVSEMTNYANWFAYYRTRIQAVKTVTSIVFSAIDTQYRVGFHNLFQLSSFVNIADFDAAQKATWYTQLFGINIPLNQQTPSLDALVRIGEYFKNGTNAQLAGSTDPIELSCQKNWHMFFTDGYTNQALLPSVTVGDQDLTVPTYPDFSTNPIPLLVPGSPWPPPFAENSGAASSNSLTDYATYYWVTDLRTSGPNAVDNVPTSTTDPAQWQHLNFAALSLGTAGKLPAGNQSVTESSLAAGTLQWPQTYPTVNQPDNSGVDDLWHAAINGRGRFVNAQTPEEMALGMGQILQDALNSAGTRTSAGFQSTSLGSAADIVYRVLFEPGWSGSLAKLQTHVDTSSGIATAFTDTQLWEASAQLSAQLQIITGVKDTPWLTERKIITRNGATGAAVPFLWANLTAAQQDSLAPGNAARGQTVVDFLRGSRLKEGTKLGQFRARTTPLGDIVDSSPVYVGPPGAPYLDGNDPGYSTFVGSLTARAPRVYVGANDGMLHAFDDVTGNEMWAYVPSPLFRGGTAGGDVKTGLGALTYQDGALPPFRHHYYVDGTPNIVDVDFDAPAGDAWHSLLVGGLGKGGNSYYALDITQPADITTEASAANRALWEFPRVGDTTKDIGYSYGKAMIAKTRSLGWVVIVASGYDNVSSIFPTGTGKGNLFVLRASDGALLKTMTTNVGTPASPSGLAHLSGYTQDFRNQLVDQVYAGDLLGNVWRFDMTDTNPNNWTVGQIASLVDPSGVPQPVTTPPEIKIDPINGIDRWVFIGTGELYDDSDLTNNQQQTLYAIRDGTATTPLAIPATPIDRNTAGMVGITHDIALNFGLAQKPDKGWFDDLPIGQRIVVPPKAALGLIAYVATASDGDPCLTGLPAFLYARDYGTGQSLLTNDSLGATGDLVNNLPSPDGAVGLQIVTFPGTTGSGNSGASDSPDIRAALTLPNGQVRYVKLKTTNVAFGHRMSWRLLGQ